MTTNEKPAAPLAGKRILLTDPIAPANPPSPLSAKLRALGAEVLERSALRIDPPTNLREFAELVQDAHAYDWIVFADAQSVPSFFDLFYKLYDDAREVGGAHFAVLGAETAQWLKQFHLHVDLLIGGFEAEALAAEFQKQGGIENLRVLVVRQEEAQDVLVNKLSALGGIVDQGFAYRINPATGDDNSADLRARTEGADMIVFNTPVAAEAFLKVKFSWPEELRIASGNAATSKTLRDLNLKVDVETKRSGEPDLAEAIAKFYREKS